MRSSLHRAMTTIVVGLIVVARASCPGPALTLNAPRPGQPPRDLRPDDHPPVNGR
jgi:hypothetical protein